MTQDPRNAQDFGRIPISRVHMHFSWPIMRSIHTAQWNTSWPHHIWAVAHSYGLPVHSDQTWASATGNPHERRTASSLRCWNLRIGKGQEPSSETWTLITAGPCHVCSWLGSLAAQQWQQTAGQHNWPQEEVNPLCSNSWMHGTDAIFRTERKKSKGFNLFWHSSVLLCSEGNLLMKRYCQIITSHSLDFTNNLWRTCDSMALKNSTLV